MKRYALPLVLGLLPGLAAAAAMYRWVDQNGVVQYTQTPPPGLQADKVAPAPPPSANPGIDAVRELNQNAAKTREEKAKKEAEATQQKAGREDLCKRAQERVAFMETRSPTRVATKNADGSTRRLTVEEYDKDLGEARTVVSKNCS